MDDCASREEHEVITSFSWNLTLRGWECQNDYNKDYVKSLKQIAHFRWEIMIIDLDHYFHVLNFQRIVQFVFAYDLPHWFDLRLSYRVENLEISFLSSCVLHVLAVQMGFDTCIAFSQLFQGQHRWFIDDNYTHGYITQRTKFQVGNCHHEIQPQEHGSQFCL